MQNGKGHIQINIVCGYEHNCHGIKQDWLQPRSKVTKHDLNMKVETMCIWEIVYKV